MFDWFSRSSWRNRRADAAADDKRCVFVMLPFLVLEQPQQLVVLLLRLLLRLVVIIIIIFFFVVAAELEVLLECLYAKDGRGAGCS